MTASGPRQFLSLCAVIAAVTVPLAIAGLKADPVSPPAAAERSPGEVLAEARRIARGVEEVRDLRFARLPASRVVTAAELRQIFLRQQPQGRERTKLRAGEAALKLLGLLAPEDDVDDLTTAIADETAGAYDPRSERLYVVRGIGLDDPSLVEITLAHELTHALEDQRFELPESDEISDDRVLAREALVEGSATAVMFRYAARFVDPLELLQSASDPELEQVDAETGLPEALEAQLFFAYLRGRGFVSTLVQVGKGWNLVDIALRSRPPLSTEQVLHPYKYLTYERPLVVALPKDTLRSPWRHLGAGVLGEFDTFQLLRGELGEDRARRLAAGWGGQRTRLWRRGDPPCTPPCRRRDALVAAWRWDTPEDGRQFARGLRTYVADGLDASADGPDLWSLGGGWVGLRAEGALTRLAFAPSAKLARALAAGG